MQVVLSVSFVLLFGEILPSALFTGASQVRTRRYSSLKTKNLTDDIRRPRALQQRVRQESRPSIGMPHRCEPTANCIIVDHFPAFESGLVAPFLYAA